MTDEERLADIKERFGPEAVRIGDRLTAADAELLLRLIRQCQNAIETAGEPRSTNTTSGCQHE